MDIDTSFFDKKIAIDSIDFGMEGGDKMVVDILRLDQIHPHISGNKWFKLKYNLLKAKEQGAKKIISFGGAYSNHLHALAFAGKQFDVPTLGIVRGEKVDNPTLDDCKNWGMGLQFVSRADYKNKTDPTYLQTLADRHPDSYIIPEGGDNELGKKGCTEIIQAEMTNQYDILCCAIGTGTTIAGMCENFKKPIWGFAPFKNAHSLQEKISNTCQNLKYMDQYHFGGFGKVKPELLDFMIRFTSKYDIELDQVYTAKMFYGLQRELKDVKNMADKKILVVHTGGVQGNRSKSKP